MFVPTCSFWPASALGVSSWGPSTVGVLGMCCHPEKGLWPHVPQSRALLSWTGLSKAATSGSSPSLDFFIYEMGLTTLEG